MRSAIDAACGRGRCAAPSHYVAKRYQHVDLWTRGPAPLIECSRLNEEFR
jgi:hypothetical protein